MIREKIFEGLFMMEENNKPKFIVWIVFVLIGVLISLGILTAAFFVFELSH